MENEGKPIIFIDPNILFDLQEEEEKGRLKWTGNLTVCCNCKNTEARTYELLNSGVNRWDVYYYCDFCGYDSWAQAIDDFNFDMNVLGGV